MKRYRDSSITLFVLLMMFLFFVMNILSKKIEELKLNKAIGRSSGWNPTLVIDFSFVLISIFMLSVGFTKERSYTPTSNSNKIKHLSDGLTILLLSDNEIYWYEGDLETQGQIHLTNYSDNGLRKVLNNTKILYRSKNIQLSVTIKTNRSTSYENVINSIDELRITDIKRYAVQDMSIEEATMIPKITL